MQPVLLSVTGTAVSTTIIMDYMQNPFNIGIGVNVTNTGGATVGWRVEHSFDNMNAFNATVSNWFPNAAIGTSATAATSAVFLDMNYAYPVRAIRLNVLSATATTVVIANIVPASNAP